MFNHFKTGFPHVQFRPMSESTVDGVESQKVSVPREDAVIILPYEMRTGASINKVIVLLYCMKL